MWGSPQEARLDRPELGGSIRAAEIDAIFAPFSGSDSPGCQLGVLFRGEFVYKKAYGMADLERHVPLTTSAPIVTGSIAKQFTAAVVAHLAREKKLSLSDSIRKYFPEMPAYADAITIDHLIHHTSGLRDYLGLVAIGGEPDDFHTSESEFLELLTRQKALNFEPGTKHLYSNSGYVLLSILVRRVTGKSLRAASDEILFVPLGMKHTFFDDRPAELVPDRVLGYSRRGTRFVLDTNASNGVVGDGALFTSVEDLRLWDRYLSSEVAEELFTGTKLKDATAVPYAFGLTLNSFFGRRLIAHGGSYKGYRAQLFKLPAEKLTVVCLCNSSDADPSGRAAKVAALLLNRKLPEQPASPPAKRQAVTISQEELAKYAGVYYSPDLDAAYEVTVGQGKLAFRCKHSIFDAEPEGENRFRFSNYSIQFDVDSKGKVTGYTLNALRVWNLHWDRRD
jgi:CubicO group peptidase (beta-lactamase class C family)